jgi:uncharacterized phage-associated protein
VFPYPSLKLTYYQQNASLDALCYTSNEEPNSKSDNIVTGGYMNKDKYRNAILFFAENVTAIGVTKLNKLLYFLDFDHFEKYGEAVTDDIYENKDLGPVPRHIDDILAEMQAEKLIDIVPEQVVDFVRYRLLATAKHNPSVFKPSEIEILCEVAEKWSRHTAKEIVIASHGEAPWLATRNGEDIPYPLAYYRGKFEKPSYDEELIETSISN